jgi:hypothetical protein
MTELFGAASVLLARVDDTDYLAVRAVYAVHLDEPPLLYCLESEWEAMPMARIALLQSRVAELESRLTAMRNETPLREIENGKIPCDEPGCLDWIKPRGMAAHKRQAHGISITGARTPPAPAQGQRHKCPHCNARPKAQGLAEHIAREHADTHLIVAVPTRPIIERASDLGWRCAEPGCAGAFTRDLHDPAHCTQHAIRSTNGHAVEVAS